MIGRAVAGGEIKRGQVSDRVAVARRLDPLRADDDLRPLAEEVIEEIVDTVFLPLVRLGAAATS